MTAIARCTVLAILREHLARRKAALSNLRAGHLRDTALEVSITDHIGDTERAIAELDEEARS